MIRYLESVIHHGAVVDLYPKDGEPRALDCHPEERISMHVADVLSLMHLCDPAKDVPHFTEEQWADFLAWREDINGHLMRHARACAVAIEMQKQD